jgi:UrcA family protein
VQFADLNTSNAPGAAVLYRRIKRAAESVCSGIEAGHELALHMLYAKCVHTALSKAVADVNSPAVSAYAAARGVVPAERTTTIARNQ